MQPASLSMTVSLLIGIPLGYCLGYFDFPGKKGLRTVVDTLLALPTVFIGLLVYAFISNRGPLGEFGLLFTLSGIAIGQAILALPIESIGIINRDKSGTDHDKIPKGILKMLICSYTATTKLCGKDRRTNKDRLCEERTTILSGC